ncbi:AAA family ATPase [uncultured Methanobrevibacter sp.]|uniref:AAA family ATPase n=1 Tax=uncultured Methanobrevibacter sp. TaxID=253161 RepID=UPI00262691E1|nr:AAA family ATPase [uncultured Methanobrevibacter sp.]
MANIVLVIGDSGTGKSASLRNFKPDEVLVINCAGKPLPFKNHFEQLTPAFEKLTKDVQKALATTEKKVVVVDDAQYIMSFQYMRRIKENGWDKWNDIQGDFFNIIQDAKKLPKDVVVYFLSHLQRDDAGHEKVKTMGKMLDEKITIEGLFTIVLKTAVTDGQYYFLTQNSGLDTVKSPIGMFDTYAIDNDLKYVDTKIRNYYEIGNYASDEEVKALDAEVAHPEVEKPDTKKRRRKERDGKKEEEKPAEAPAEEKKEETESTGTEEPVKQRRRKARTEGAESLETAMNVPDGEIPADEPKKRRRRRTKPVMGNPFEDIPDDIPDDAVPFN